MKLYFVNKNKAYNDIYDNKFIFYTIHESFLL